MLIKHDSFYIFELCFSLLLPPISLQISDLCVCLCDKVLNSSSESKKKRKFDFLSLFSCVLALILMRILDNLYSKYIQI